MADNNPIVNVNVVANQQQLNNTANQVSSTISNATATGVGNGLKKAASNIKVRQNKAVTAAAAKKSKPLVDKFDDAIYKLYDEAAAKLGRSAKWVSKGYKETLDSLKSMQSPTDKDVYNLLKSRLQPLGFHYNKIKAQVKGAQEYINQIQWANNMGSLPMSPGALPTPATNTKIAKSPWLLGGHNHLAWVQTAANSGFFTIPKSAPKITPGMSLPAVQQAAYTGSRYVDPNVIQSWLSISKKVRIQPYGPAKPTVTKTPALVMSPVPYGPNQRNYLPNYINPNLWINAQPKKPGLLATIKGALKPVLSAAKLPINAAKNALKTVGDGFKDMFDNAMKGVPGIIMGVVKKVLAFVITEIIHAGTTVFNISKKLVFKPAQVLLKGFVSLLKTAVSHSQIIQSIMRLVVVPFVLLFEYSLLPVVKFLAPLITSIVGIIVSNKDAIIKWGDALVNIMEKVITPMLSMFDGNFFANPVSGLFDIFTAMLDGMRDWVTSNRNTIVNTLTDVFISIGNFLTSSAELAAVLARAFANSILNAVNSPEFREAYPKLIEAFKSILDAVRDVLTSEPVKKAMADLVGVFIGNLTETAIELLFGNKTDSAAKLADKYGLDKSVINDSDFVDFSGVMNGLNGLKNVMSTLYLFNPTAWPMAFSTQRIGSSVNNAIEYNYVTNNFGTSSTDTFGKDGAISY